MSSVTQEPVVVRGYLTFTRYSEAGEWSASLYAHEGCAHYIPDPPDKHHGFRIFRVELVVPDAFKVPIMTVPIGEEVK